MLLQESPYGYIGLEQPGRPFHPLHDETEPNLKKRMENFTNWVSGYFHHGDHQYTYETLLEKKTPVADVPSTLQRLSPEELSRVSSPAAAVEYDVILSNKE